MKSHTFVFLNFKFLNKTFQGLEAQQGQSRVSIQSYMDRRIGPVLTDILFDLQRQKYNFIFSFQ